MSEYNKGLGDGFTLGLANGGGGNVEVEPLSVSENGTYTAASGKAYSPVNVNVPVPPVICNKYGAYYEPYFTIPDSVTEYSGAYALGFCNGLIELVLPNVISVPLICFGNNPDLKKITYGEGWTDTGANNVCMACTALEEINFPSTMRTIKNGFNREGSRLLKFIDLKNVTLIEDWCFSFSSGLETIILRADTVCSLGGTHNDFSNADIYVPRTLIEEYKAATNWSVFADNFKAIEDFPEVAGGNT